MILSTAKRDRDTTEPGVPARGRFVVLEGLGGVGKSTVAPLLATALGGDVVDTLLPELEQVRRYVDDRRSVEARMHFWMMANHLVSDHVRSVLHDGRDVVIESYFHRTLATHAAMGVRSLPNVDWDRVLVPDLAVELTLDEPARQRRLTARGTCGRDPYWSDLTEGGLPLLRRVYDSAGLVQFDTTGLSPAQVADGVGALLAFVSGAGRVR